MVDSDWPALAGSQALADDQRRVLTALLAMQRQSWEQGVTGHALLDLGRHDLLRPMARDAVLRQLPDGRLAEIDSQGLVNSAANGEAVRWAAQDSGEPAPAEALDRQLRWLRQDCPRADDGTLFHLAGGREVWSDTVYMVVPLLAAVGDVDGAHLQLAGHRRRLFDPRRRLYAARWDEDSRQLSLPALWGTGNGWVVAGIARALRHLKGDTSGADFERDAAEHAREVIDACLSYRRPDGLFHDVLDDPSTFVEANLGQMLAYAIFTGVADGWLPAAYAETAGSLLVCARERLDADGLVTGVCGAPHFDRPGISAEAQAFFLLASAAAQRLVRHRAT
ncbi:glycoside hydrolase family 88 protein [Jatrophihabitans sp.]|jgi:unsaturated rhamnogalacturonyl hydrolase|uniref:glycoside hydrolase family 88 protein n=1 Tax=Jatrophihabitans sp. TaxID=1932789 RepID=UPI002F1CE3ED